MEYIRNNRLIIEWLGNINATKNTALSYLQVMKQYTEFTGLTPDELLEEAEAEAALPARKRKLRSYLIGFRKQLTEGEFAEKTVQNQLGVVKSFYESHDITPPRIVDLQQLRQDLLIIQWLDNINATRHTTLSYLQAMKQYTEFTGLIPEELLEEAEQEAGLAPRKRKLKGYLIGFRKQLTEEGLAEKTVQSRFGAVKSFYESHDVTTSKIKGERKRATTKDDNNIVPTKDDLQECLKVCDPLERAVMLTGISSGLASNEIRALPLQKFKSGYDPETGVTTLHLTRQKTHTKFTTFLSAECSAAILDYLEFRDRELKAEGEKRQNQIAKQRTTPNSYLFIVRSVPDKYLQTRNEELRKLSENSVTKMYRSISAKARKNTKAGTYNSVRSHAMRKYFSSVLIAAGCNHEVKEYFMGHTLSATQAAYFAVATDKLKEIYIKFMPFLTIQKELDVSESPEYKKLLEDNKTLLIETERHRVERQEINELREKLIETQMKLDTLAAEKHMEEEEGMNQRAYEEMKAGIWHIDTAQAEKHMEEEAVKLEQEYAEATKMKRKGRLA